MKASKLFIPVATLALSLLALSGNAMAYSLFSHRSPTQKSVRVDVIYQSQLASGKMLPRGDYTVKVPLTTNHPAVSFYRKGKLVAQTSGRKVADTSKNPYTAVSYNKTGKTHVITRIDLQGIRESVVFPHAKATG